MSWLLGLKTDLRGNKARGLGSALRVRIRLISITSETGGSEMTEDETLERKQMDATFPLVGNRAAASCSPTTKWFLRELGPQPPGPSEQQRKG